MDIYNLKCILPLITEPEQKDDFQTWIQQQDVIPFLEHEFEDEHIILYASLPFLFIHAVLIPDVPLKRNIVKDLLKWSHHPYSTWGLVVSSDDAWIEGPLAGAGSKTLSKGEQLIYARSFEGNNSQMKYFEMDQKISHVLGLHFMAERNAWCRLDEFGDIEDVVKIFEVKDLPKRETGTIITVRKAVLGEYTGVSNYTLCRMFDFTRCRMGSFSGWGGKNEPANIGNKKDLFGTLVIQDGYGGYSRGIQVKK